MTFQQPSSAIEKPHGGLVARISTYLQPTLDIEEPSTKVPESSRNGLAVAAGVDGIGNVRTAAAARNVLGGPGVLVPTQTSPLSC